ncbi:MAG: UDP-N-acetylmuramoyl-tripeptide--D-alanyl-D-alanine ligase [Nitrosomonadales bacterium]
MKINLKEIPKILKKLKIEENFEFDSKDIYTDTRNPIKNGIFIALLGKTFDAHDFVNQIEKTKPTLIFTEKIIKTDLPQVVVSSTKELLKDLSNNIRVKSKATFVGITGSNGKTTTKELIIQILKQFYNNAEVVGTIGNFNNEIGLPLSMFQVTKKTKYAIFEVGTNHPGEIKQLAKILRPNIALITNIGEAHIGNFGSKEKIAFEKKSLFDYLLSTDTVLLNTDNKYTSDVQEIDCKKFTISSNKSSADIFWTDIDETNIRLNYQGTSIEIRNPLIGKHNNINLLFAIGVVLNLGIEIEKIQQSLMQIKSPKGRMERISGIQGSIIIDDTYNSNPTSLLAAVDFLERHNGYKILVIGDIAEMGPEEEVIHQELGKKINNKKIDLILGVGPLTRLTLNEIKKVKNKFFEEKEELYKFLEKFVVEDTMVLVKGSRSARMDLLIDRLRVLQ